jgi:hypothetical protein
VAVAVAVLVMMVALDMLAVEAVRVAIGLEQCQLRLEHFTA